MFSNSVASRRSALVVGAGLAGLTAAYRLQNAGFQATVLEKRADVGGRVRTERRAGYTIDTGPDAMTAGYRNYQRIAGELGLQDQFVPSSTIVGTVRAGRVHDVDSRSVMSMLGTRALTWRGKLRMGLGLWQIRKLFKGVSSSQMVNFADLDDPNETAEDFALRHLGREATDYIVDPLIRLVVGSGARQSSRLGVLGAMVDWSVPLINIKGGLDTLPRAIAANVPVITGATVENVSETDAGVTVHYRDPASSTHELHADVCVIGATYDVAERIYAPLATLAGDDYAKHLRYITMLAVSLAYRKAPDTKAYVVQVPTVENADISLIFLQHNKAPDRVPPGRGLVTFYTDSIATHRFIERSDADIEAWSRSQIEKLFPELATHFEFATITRWPVVGYLATPGFWRRTRALLAALPEGSRVQITGDLFGAGSMESAVTWGGNIAERIIRHWS